MHASMKKRGSASVSEQIYLQITGGHVGSGSYEGAAGTISRTIRGSRISFLLNVTGQEIILNAQTSTIKDKAVFYFILCNRFVIQPQIMWNI